MPAPHLPEFRQRAVELVPMREEPVAEIAAMTYAFISDVARVTVSVGIVWSILIHGVMATPAMALVDISQQQWASTPHWSCSRR